MGWGYIIAYAFIAIASAATYFLVKSNQQAVGDDLSPNSIDAFNVTMASEGSVVPIIFGIVRVNTNLLWYGNLVTQALTQEIDGGKKGDDETVITGYRYFMDLHHAIGVGVINVLTIYNSDREITIDAPPADPFAFTTTWNTRSTTYRTISSNIYVNPGCSTAKPAYGANSPAMQPISHVWMPRMWLGDNVSSAPSYHLIVEKYFESGHPLSFPRHYLYGSSVASVIYEVLLMAGVTTDEIDLTTFESAARAFDFRDYYISLTLTSQDEWRSHIKKIISNYVDATLRKNWSNGKYELIAHDEYIHTTYGFGEQDFVEFSFNRPGWDDTYNDLRANYTNREQQYTRRSIRAYNSASIQMLGYSRQKTIDLTAFNDVTVASKRLWQLLKRYSFPTAVIKFKTGLWGARLPGPGELIGIDHQEYGLTGSSFRILDKRISEEDQNYIDWICEEDIDNSFTLGYQAGGEGGWVPPDYGADPLIHQSVFELPYNPDTTNSKSFVCLAARENEEVSFAIMFSTDGSEYTTILTGTQWSMYGTLDELYDDETEEIDDDVGILFTPYNESSAPTFSDVSRTNLYNLDRVAIIDNEIMGFQTMTPEGESSYRLTGVIRGAYNTPIQQHSSSAPIWLTTISVENRITVTQTNFYLKYLPRSVTGVTVDAGDASAINVSGVAKAATPYPPHRIKAVRTGTQVVFTWLPVTRIAAGAGTDTPDVNSDGTNLYEGDFYFDADVGSHDQYVDGMTLTIDQAGAFNVTIKNRVNNILSFGVTIAVGSDDGEYIGPDITYT